MLISSCATLLNGKKTQVIVKTNEPTKISVNGDTINNVLKVSHVVKVKRSDAPLRIDIFNTSASKSVELKAKTSFAYWLNIIPNLHFWTGFYIDTKTKSRYTYPNFIYIDLKKRDTTHLTNMPFDTTFLSYKHLIKFSPLRVVDFLHPSIELSYERYHNKKHATQVLTSFLLPNNQLLFRESFSPKSTGFRLGLEHRLYLNNTAPKETYVAIESNYFNGSFRDMNAYNSYELPIIDTNTNFVTKPIGDSINVKKQTFSVNLKIGHQYIFKRLAIDFFAGLGARYKNVTYFDKLFPSQPFTRPKHPNIEYMSNREGKYWTLSVVVGLKIGLCF